MTNFDQIREVWVPEGMVIWVYLYLNSLVFDFEFEGCSLDFEV